MAITREISGGVYSGELPFPVREKRGNGGGDGADRWVPPVGEGKRERGYRFGFCGKWAAGSFQYWAETFPRGLFYFYFSFASFLFLFSKFVHTLFKFESKMIQTNFVKFQ
jgi:hypothetical protein